jgi:hypothetical protein
MSSQLTGPSGFGAQQRLRASLATNVGVGSRVPPATVVHALRGTTSGSFVGNTAKSPLADRPRPRLPF